MSIVQGTCVSFKVDLMRAIHDFESDTFMLAFFLPTANIGPDVIVYDTAGEVDGTGYVAGGFQVVADGPFSQWQTAISTFETLVTPNLTIEGVAGGLIYNSSKGNRAVCSLDFGRTLGKTDEPITVTFPAADRNTGLIRIA